MKKSIYAYLGVLMVGACTLPDAKEVNPARLKDAPAYSVSAVGAGTAGKVTTILFGQTTEFDITVVDAPGKIADVTSSISVPDYATSATDGNSLASLVGQETGTAKVILQPMATPADKKDRSFNFVINVMDSQVDIKTGVPAAKTTSITQSIILTAGPCVSDGIKAGNYSIISASGVLDGGGGTYNLDSLIVWNGLYGPPTVAITSTRSGLFTFSDITAQLWPIYYGRASPNASVDLCGTVVTGHTGSLTFSSRLFTVNGTLNSDGTITITWSYVKTSGTTPNPSANGTYTLKKI